jgi:hypothetical protein
MEIVKGTCTVLAEKPEGNKLPWKCYVQVRE